MNTKKDSDRLNHRSNQMIMTREDDEMELNRSTSKNRMNVERIMMERQMVGYGDHDPNYVGELTGEMANPNDYQEKGMPLRSSITSVRREKYDLNQHIDFDLHKKTVPDKNVQYNDTSMGEYAGLDEAMRTITKANHPFEQTVDEINILGLFLNEHIYKGVKNARYMINNLGLYQMFAVLYRFSGGSLAQKMRDYFGFHDIKHVMAGLMTINQKYKKNNLVMTMCYLMYRDGTDPPIKRYSESIRPIRIDGTEDNHKQINRLLQKVHHIAECLSWRQYQTIDNTLCVVSKLQMRLIDRPHMVDEKKMVMLNREYEYYENHEYQMIEIPMENSMVIGVVNNLVGVALNMESLMNGINQMKRTMFQQIITFNMTKIVNKTRMNTILQTTGMDQVFNQPNRMLDNLTDIRQYLTIEISYDQSGKSKNTPRDVDVRGSKKFITTTRPQIYIRDVEYNMILVVGTM